MRTVLSLIPTEPVAVIRPTVERDDLGEPVFGEPVREDVRCVVCPGATSYAGELRGCSVEVRGERYDVVGDPQRTTDTATPGPFDMAAEVTRADG